MIAVVIFALAVPIALYFTIILPQKNSIARLKESLHDIDVERAVSLEARRFWVAMMDEVSALEGTRAQPWEVEIDRSGPEIPFTLTQAWLTGTGHAITFQDLSDDTYSITIAKNGYYTRSFSNRSDAEEQPLAAFETFFDAVNAENKLAQPTSSDARAGVTHIGGTAGSR